MRWMTLLKSNRAIRKLESDIPKLSESLTNKRILMGNPNRIIAQNREMKSPLGESHIASSYLVKPNTNSRGELPYIGGNVGSGNESTNNRNVSNMEDPFVERSSKAERPSWRQSEKDVSSANPDYGTQKSFKNAEEVPYGTKGSVRPDNYKEGASIEVKNYNVTTASGRNRLVDNISKQVEQRVENLPADTSQKVVIDVRGQNVSNDALREIRDSMLSKTGRNVEIQFLR